MNIADYDKVQDLRDTDAFLIDGARGTKTILTTHLAKQIFNRIGSKELLDKATPSVLPEDTALEPSDLIAVQTGDGMRKVRFETLTNMYADMPKTSDEYFEMLDAFADRSMRNNIYRGKKLGAVFSPNAHINAKGMFVGDYFERTVSTGATIKWVFVDLNYGYLKNKTKRSYSLIMPKYKGTVSQVDNFRKKYGSTTQGYVGSGVRTYLRSTGIDGFAASSEVYEVFDESLFAQVTRPVTYISGSLTSTHVYDRFILPHLSQLLGFSYYGYTLPVNTYKGDERQLAISVLKPLFLTDLNDRDLFMFMCQEIWSANTSYITCVRTVSGNMAYVDMPSISAEAVADGTPIQISPIGVISC